MKILKKFLITCTMEKFKFIKRIYTGFFLRSTDLSRNLEAAFGWNVVIGAV